ncbi:MAG: hypothetical protein GPJ54_12590 [Candidatus Heimdallarchaeota archaeon]|nr:hypothetical protein [Candidatus Heimdallarchaeota archaeon]
MTDAQIKEKFDKLISGLFKDDLDNVEQLINEIEDNEKQFDNELKIEFSLLKARYNRQNRNFELAENLINNIDVDLISDNLVLLFKHLVEYESIKARQGYYQDIPKNKIKRETRLTALDKGDQLLSELDSSSKEIVQNDIGIFLDLQGLFQYYSRQMEKSKSLFLKSREILSNTGDLFQEISSILNLAYCQLYLGDFTNSEKNLKIVENVGKQYSDKEYLFWATQGYAIINSFRGNMQTSLRYYNSSLELLGPMNEPGMEADILHILGIIFWERAELDNALESFNKILKLPFEKVNQTALAISLFYSILIYLEKNNREKAIEILSLLEKITTSTNDPLYNFGLRLAKALILKYSPKLMDKLVAKQEFEELRLLPIENSRLSLILLTQISEILLIEYKAVEDPDILIQIKSLMEELHNIGKAQNSSLLIADSFYILSKIAIIEDDFKTAEQYLINGLELAEDKRLLNLAKKFSSEYDKLHQKYSEFDTDKNDKTRINPYIDFESAIHNIGNTSSLGDWEEIEPEKPMMVIVISEGGNVRFTRTFDTQIKLNHHLIASFITAINSFSQNTFDSLKPIERINYYEYTIAIRAFEKTLICYIFTGDSFFAFKKLRLAVEKIQGNQDLNRIIIAKSSSLDGMKNLDDETELIDLIENVILTDVGS